ncbi:MAG: small multi-drug export protein [Candidatus Hydrogenedentes bacterium]|nr:small multi-drug export protein [Candidatus Hydrogenedentota bacterium]
MQDNIIMFYAFPLIVTGLTVVEKWPVVGPALAHIHELAQRHKARLAPYGVVGLSLFVLFPIWTTGPLVGVVVGYLLGLGVVFSFAAVIVGNTIAAALWIWAFDYINVWLLEVNENLPWILMAAIIVASIIGGLWHRWQKRQEAIKSSRDAEEKKPGLPQPE